MILTSNDMRETRQIDLHLPRGWNDLTPGQMEEVSSVLTGQAAAGNGNINMEAVRTRLFFRLSGLDVKGPSIKGDSPGDTAIPVARKGGKEVFTLSVWQIHYWIEERMKWLDTPCTRLMFPYPFHTAGAWTGRRCYEGPAALMQNFSYRQYRLSGEYLNWYVLEGNRLASMRKETGSPEWKRQGKAVGKAKGMFLATLFNRRHLYRDAETGRMKKGYRYVSTQSADNWRDFASFPDVKFQCVLLWWSATMLWLKKRYPKVFREGKPERNPQTNPLELYTRTTATMEKYLGLNEESVNRELYLNVLQHLQDMMDESDRMKELERKR